MGGPGGDAPQKPEEAPDKEAEDTEETDPEETITWEDISEGDTVKITLAEDGTAAEITLITMGMGQPGGGQSQEPEENAAVTEYTEDTQTEGESYLSFGTDENAVHVLEDTEGKTVTIMGTDGTVYEEGDGEYTITVDYYEDTTDLSGASQTTQWSSSEVEKPTEL